MQGRCHRQGAAYVGTYTRLVFYSHGGKDHKIGQIEGLSYTDVLQRTWSGIRIGERVMHEYDVIMHAMIQYPFVVRYMIGTMPRSSVCWLAGLTKISTDV